MKSRLLNDQKGFTLPLAMVVLAVGILIVIPFLIGMSLTLISSRNSQVSTHEQYALDAAYEDVVWDLKYGTTLAESLTGPCDSIEYPLQEKVNGLQPDIKVTWTSDCGGDDGLDPKIYLISVKSGSSSLTREYNDGSIIAAVIPKAFPTPTPDNVGGVIPKAFPTPTPDNVGGVIPTAIPTPTPDNGSGVIPTATPTVIPTATPTPTPTPDPEDVTEPTPRDLKQRVVDNLSPYIKDSKKYGKRFKKAVEETEKSLDPKLWGTKPGNSGKGNSGKNGQVIDPFRLDLKEGKKDFKHEEKAVKELKELLKGFADDKCGGVTSITLEYTGPGIMTVEAFLKGTLLGTFTVVADDPDLDSNYDSTFEISATEETGGKLDKEIRLVVGGSEVAKIDTSCSKPIEIGDVHGDFIIDDLEKLPSKDKDKLEVSAESLEFARMAVEDLLTADRILAQVFLEENQGLVAINPKKQEKVEKELGKAAEELAKGDAERAASKTQPDKKSKPDKVIKRYGKAWEKTAKAVKEATKK